MEEQMMIFFELESFLELLFIYLYIPSNFYVRC